MQTEIEAKFLAIDHDDIRKKLTELGATCEQPMRLMKRINMDFADRRLQQQNGWLRLRDEGYRVTLTYKHLATWELDGVQEAETTVQDFGATKQILESIGLAEKSYQETQRETWRLNGVEIMLDQWPWTKPFVEIEGPSEGQVKEVAARLELDWQDALFGSVEPVYLAEYDITEEEFYTLSHMTFEEDPPKWLVARRKLTA